MSWIRRMLGSAIAATMALALQAGAQVTPDRVGTALREGGTVVVYGATDRDVVQPVIAAFEAQYRGLHVDYHDMNSSELYQRFVAESEHGTSADVLWSSAMDLQVKLVNDGYAQPWHSPETASLPAWATWKDEAFATTYEPAAFVYNKRALSPDEVPDTHAALIRLLAEHPARFRGRLATYDPARSGLGLLLHSQDAQANPTAFWQLVRTMGGEGIERHASTAKMLDRIASGEVLIGYNLLGSYAQSRAQRDPGIGVVWPRDYTLVLSRVAFIARKAQHPAAARLWLDFLLSAHGQEILAQGAGLFSVREDAPGKAASSLRQQLGSAFRPIALGTSLLAYLDQIKRRDFLREWDDAMHPR
jgi:iron(III) transport system substrate-binding protein